MTRELLGDLVPLEDVLERADPEAEVLGDPHQHEDLVLTVAVTVNQTITRQDLGQRLEFKVSSHRHRRGVVSLRIQPAFNHH